MRIILSSRAQVCGRGWLRRQHFRTPNSAHGRTREAHHVCFVRCEQAEGSAWVRALAGRTSERDPPRAAQKSGGVCRPLLQEEVAGKRRWALHHVTPVRS